MWKRITFLLHHLIPCFAIANTILRFWVACKALQTRRTFWYCYFRSTQQQCWKEYDNAGYMTREITDTSSKKWNRRTEAAWDPINLLSQSLIGSSVLWTLTRLFRVLEYRPFPSFGVPTLPFCSCFPRRKFDRLHWFAPSQDFPSFLVASSPFFQLFWHFTVIRTPTNFFQIFKYYLHHRFCSSNHCKRPKLREKHCKHWSQRTPVFSVSFCNW